MSWLFSQALVAEYSAANSLDGGACAPLNVMPTPHPFWHRDKTTDVLNHSLFGPMSAPLTADLGGDLLTWFREDSLAKTFPPQGRGQESAEAGADCGEKWRGLSVKFDPASCGWKTHHCLFQEDLDWSCLTLPKWGMMQDGELWERTTQGLPIGGSESGSGENWPTPSVCGNYNRKGASATSGDGLATAVYAGGTQTRQMWRTPAAQEPGVSAERLEPIDGGTPGGMNRHFDKETGRMAQIGLEQQVKLRQMWPTPRAAKTSSENQESWEARNAKGDVATPPLGLAVKMWATPRCFMHKDSQTDRGKSNPGEQVGGQLNPDWVEWLMGWPIGWTASAPLETGRFRRWCGLHGMCCLENKRG